VENSNRLRIVIADSQHFFRRGLRTVLACEPDFEIVGEAASAEECLAKTEADLPDVLVLEAGLIGESQRNVLRGLNPTVALLILCGESSGPDTTTFDDTNVLKNEPPRQIAAAIRKAAGRTQASVSPSNTSADLHALAASTSAFAVVPGLTTRENEIVKILAEGHTVREVAEDLGLSIKTVESHKLNVMRKLGIHNRAALIRYAAQHGVNEPVAARSPVGR
jgi:two-component system response regulator NreC